MEPTQMLGKLKICKIDDINFGDRRREDYGDLGELARSIKERGLIHPIAVQSDTGEPPFILAAGGRRFLACKLLEMQEITCRIYDHPLTQLELRAIELLENIDRKDLNFAEECRLKRNIHELMVEMHGKKLSTSPDAEGWSKRDTATLLGKSIGGVTEDIKLAEAIEALPELGLDKAKNKREAMKTLQKTEETMIRAELAKRAERILGSEKRRLVDTYIVGDFFDYVKSIPNEVYDLVEIDPPYAIELQKVKKSENSYKSVYGDSYNEVDIGSYKDFMQATLKESYRVMNQHSWLICWFGPEPWFQPMYEWITDAGFKTRRLPGLWIKGTHPGQSMQPSIYLANAAEYFFYAYKGDANIAKAGRSNVFNFNPVLPAQKTHPTERPVEMMKEILTTFSWEGARVLVPFAGSGNTLIAAFESKMFPLGFDLSKAYKDGFVTNIMGRKEVTNGSPGVHVNSGQSPDRLQAAAG